MLDPAAETILRRATRTQEPELTPKQDENGHWVIEIPCGSGGLQVFRGLTTKDLAGKLARSVYFGTLKIHDLTQLLKANGEDEAERRYRLKLLSPAPNDEDF